MDCTATKTNALQTLAVHEIGQLDAQSLFNIGTLHETEQLDAHSHCLTLAHYMKLSS